MKPVTVDETRELAERLKPFLPAGTRVETPADGGCNLIVLIPAGEQDNPIPGFPGRTGYRGVGIETPAGLGILETPAEPNNLYGIQTGYFSPDGDEPATLSGDYYGVPITGVPFVWAGTGRRGGLPGDRYDTAEIAFLVNAVLNAISAVPR